MKRSTALTVLFVALGIFIGMPLVHAQDALKELNTTSTDQKKDASSVNHGVISQEETTETKAMDADKIKASMSSDEFKKFSGAKAYIDQNSKYTLGADDEINLTVMRHPEVSGLYTINKEGKIQYEFVGDVELAGLTKEQAVEILAKKLSVYIIKPDISLEITGYNSKIVYVVGEVARPGRVPMHGDTITVRDALLEAGLPLIGSAATDSASIFTPAESGNVVRKKVNVEALLYKGDLRENYVLHPGDCLYVPATFLAKAMRAISPVTQPISEVAGASGAAKYAM